MSSEPNRKGVRSTCTGDPLFIAQREPHFLALKVRARPGRKLNTLIKQDLTLHPRPGEDTYVISISKMVDRELVTKAEAMGTRC